MGNYRLSIDPGIRGTGVAVWESRYWTKAVTPVSILNLYPRNGDDWVKGSNTVSEKLSNVFSEYRPTAVYCEFPLAFDGIKGNAALVSKGGEPGDVLKLTYLVGMISGLCFQCGAKFVPYTVNQWKGQLSKQIVEDRILRTIPEVASLKPKSHSWDAIGIGLFAKGVCFQ